MVFRNEEGENKISEDFVISNQVPSSGVQILEGGTIIVE